MKALHLTYRFGRDVVGGAEHYMHMLSRALVRGGVEVDLWATRTALLPPIRRFGVRWDNAIGQRRERLDGIDVRRYTTGNLPRRLVLLMDRWLTARWRREERSAGVPLAAVGTGSLGPGWYPPETYGALTMRWTEGRAAITIHDHAISEIRLEAMCPRGLGGRLEVNGRTAGVFRTTEAWTPFRFATDASDLLKADIVLEGTWRPVADPRRLGIAVRRVGYVSRGREKSIELKDDDLRRLRRDRDAWIAHLAARARARPWLFEALFFLLRAPLAPAMLGALATAIKRYDVVLAQMTPYSTLNYAVAFGARYGVPVILLPHFHTDDDFYHLRHYYQAFRGASLVLAFSPYQKAFFEGLGARSEVIGGGGVDPAEFLGHGESGRSFRRKFGLADDVPLVLFVGRKSRSKRYDAVIDAVDVLHEHLGCKLVMIGPDEDGHPITSPNVLYLGRQERAVVLASYYAADVFVMMSESESFGMVFLEAWMAKKPVIGNRACGAVGDLIDDGHDGFLCADALECAEKLAELILDKRLAHRFGANGYDKVMQDYTWDAISTKVATIYGTVSGGTGARRREARR